METAIATSLPWWRRLIRRFQRVRPEPGPFVAGADFVSNAPTRPGYEVAAAMSAYVAFPWVFAAVNAIAQDFASRPVRLYRSRKGTDEEIEAHDLLDLLNVRPSTRVNAGHFHRQAIVDRVLPGNAFRLVLGGRVPTSLIRLHPKRVEIDPASDGQPEWYIYDAGGLRIRYSWESVQHIRGPSWSETPEGLFGAGAIEALHKALTAENASWERQAEANKQGRPDYLASPRVGPNSPPFWASPQLAEVRAALDRITRANHGGIAISPQDVELQKLSWSPTELAAKDMREEVRDAVLGAFGVPPTRVALPTANYAQSAEQMRGYWQHTIGGFAAEFDAADTELAMLWDRSLYVRRDFSDVPALQEDSTRRLERVRTHWLMGVSLASAYRTEGLPIPDGVTDEPPPPQPAQEPARGMDALARWIGTASTRTPDASNAPGDTLNRVVVGEQARAAAWRSWATELHGPIQARMQRAVGLFLRGQQDRFIRRAALVLDVPERAHTRAVVSDVEIDRILDPLTEDRLLRDALGDELLAAVKKAFESALRAAGSSLDFTPDRSPVASLVAALVANVNPTTRDAVRQSVIDSLAAGESVADLQGRIRRMPEFGPARALTIARTESTRAVGQGTHSGYQAAILAGVKLKQEWLSSRDSAVRDAHAEMDGQIVEVGQPFTAPGGQKANFPGGFADPALSINCRCTVLPVLE